MSGFKYIPVQRRIDFLTLQRVEGKGVSSVVPKGSFLNFGGITSGVGRVSRRNELSSLSANNKTPVGL